MNDLIPPFDPTEYTTISGAALYQLVSGLVPSDSRGLIVITADVSGIPNVPDAIADTTLQRYIWIRTQAATASAYVWNPNGVLNTAGIGLQKWIPVSNSVAALSITGAMIAPATITSDKIYSVDYAQLTNTPDSLPPSGTASGTNPASGLASCLTGQYPYPQLANGVITNNNIDAGKLTPTTVLRGSGAAEDLLGSGLTNGNMIEFFTRPSIIKDASGVKATASNAKKIPYCATGVGTDGGTWVMKTIDNLFADATANGMDLLLAQLGTAQYQTIASGISNQAMPQLEEWTSQTQSLGVIAVSSSTVFSVVTPVINSFPFQVRVVLQCTTTDSPVATFSEYDLFSFYFQNGSGTDLGRPSICANSNKTVSISFPYGTVYIKVWPSGSTAPLTITPSRWTVKVYVRGF